MLQSILYNTPLGTLLYCICYICYMGNLVLLVDCYVSYSFCQPQQISWCMSSCETGVSSTFKGKLCVSSAFATPPTFLFSLLSHSLNFPRGKGPLKNSSDVINAAKKIAEAGSRMDKLARAVADQVALQLCLSLSLLASVWNCVWLCHRGWRRSKFWVRVSGHGHWKSLMWALTGPAGAVGCVAAWLGLPMGPTLREQDSRTKLCL